ncbi:CST complex subunit STN1 isoform X2 [Poecilia reticulata]|uniref:CST complex subunit STN1 isoform X2 n=1 Tax=Poecilia reticulata TaxID=8081 RepID=UPI0007EB7664|nr:PREDICTED: CST complex subunit STN1 isoform X2 [Poecilia reticulata]
MQAAAMDPADEPPSMLWGMDPIFSAFARLFVRDILQMTESVQVPGIYFYNLHPIYKVDVLGTVVYKRERDDFFCYGAGTKHSDAAEGGFDLVAELRKLQQKQRKRCHLEIGELIRVRGPVKTSRQQREITASTYYKVDDPVMAVQIAWMMEVPQLYRLFYDKHFQLDAAGDSAETSLSKATNIIKDFLKQRLVAKFRPYDVQDLLQPLVSSRLQTQSAGQEAVAGPSGCQQLNQLLKEVLQVLQDEGTVYRKVKSQDEVYHVTIQDKDLLITVKDIIREDSKREKYAEKGCHILHILSAVRQRYSLNVSKAALELVLQTLECDSDIVSTSDSHYIAF